MRLKEIMTKAMILNNGIITKLNIKGYLPGLFTKQETRNFDLEYITGHSGEKNISPLVKNLLKDNKKRISVITSEYDYVKAYKQNIVISDKYNMWDQLSDIIGQKFSYKWKKSYETLSLEYNPIHNNNYEDKEQYNITLTSHDERSTNMTEENSNNINDDVYGFNSVNPSPTDHSEVKGRNVTTGDVKDNFKDSKDTKEGSTTHTIKGSKDIIQQDLINKELKLRRDNIFIKIVMQDIDSILTLSIY